MSVDTSGIVWWFENRVKGRYFRRKKGWVVYRSDKLEIDRSYEDSYNFVNVFVKTYDVRNGRGKTFSEHEIRYDMIECNRDGSPVHE
jgi:hypothetical protein